MSVNLDQELNDALPMTLIGRAMSRVMAPANDGLRRTILAITDQAVVSGTRFMTTALLGRACGAKELGSYALVFTIYSVTACSQEALVSVPYTIFGNRLSGDERRRFAGSSLAHYGMLSGSASLLSAIAALVMWLFGLQIELAPVMATLAVAFPLACLVEFARRFCLAELDLKAVLSVDIMMSVLQVSTLALLALCGWLSAATAYGSVALAGAATGAYWWSQMRGRFVFDRAQIAVNAVRNWQFSRWLVAGQIVFLARAAALWLLAALAGAAASGKYAACETIILLANPLLLAFNNILAPQLARVLATGGVAEVRRVVGHSTGVLAILSGLLSLFFLLFGDRILLLLFGGSFAGQRDVLLPMALAVFVEGFGMASASGLWAIELPRYNLLAISLGTIVSLVMIFALTPGLGAAGAAWGAVCGRAVTSSVFVGAFLLNSRMRQPAEALT